MIFKPFACFNVCGLLPGGATVIRGCTMDHSYGQSQFKLSRFYPQVPLRESNQMEHIFFYWVFNRLFSECYFLPFFFLSCIVTVHWSHVMIIA